MPAPRKARERIDRAAAADRIKAAYREGRPPTIGANETMRWVYGVDLLIRTGQFEIAEYGVRHLLAAYPNLEYAKTASSVLAHLPPTTGRHPPFGDDPAKDAQVVRAGGADAVVLFFCDKQNHLALPLNLMHRWFGYLPASLVYLRDFRMLMYLDGMHSFGPGRGATLSALRDIVASLGARRILCFGNSSGTFAALQYGLDLGADAVLAYAGFTNLSDDFVAHHRSTATVTRLLKEMSAGDGLDLRTLYAAAPKPPRVRIVFGENNWDDRLHAEHLRELPSVMLDPLPDYTDHDALIESICRGLLPEQLDWLAGHELAWGGTPRRGSPAGKGVPRR